jgi:DNA-binding NarL/FixJ family response regulator
MAGGKDFEAFRQIRIRLPETRLLGLAGDARIPSPNGLLTGYVAKSARGTEILAAVARALSHDRQSFSRETPAAGAELTPRQRVVLRMLAQGKSSKEMAHALSISLKTVEFHRQPPYLLGVGSTAELASLAFQLGY